MSRLLGFLRGAAREALIVLGLFAVVVVVGLGWRLSGHGGPERVAEVPAVVVAPVAGGVVVGDPFAGPVGESCACSAGLLCEGPRGGKFCTADDGRKKYK